MDLVKKSDFSKVRLALLSKTSSNQIKKYVYDYGQSSNDFTTSLIMQEMKCSSQ